MDPLSRPWTRCAGAGRLRRVAVVLLLLGHGGLLALCRSRQALGRPVAAPGNPARGSPAGGPVRAQRGLRLRRLGLAYFGGFDPAAIGLRFALPPKAPIPGDSLRSEPDAEPGPQPGWFAVSVAILHGCQYGIPDGRGGTEFTDRPYYAYFQRFRPAATAGYSIYIYHVTPDEANRVRRELGLLEISPETAARNSRDAATCPAQ
jgi:hypothetical protein